MKLDIKNWLKRIILKWIKINEYKMETQNEYISFPRRKNI